MNSYITVQEADNLLQFHQFAAIWGSISDDEKEYRLKKASQEIDDWKVFIVGLKPDGQQLEFPRVGQTEIPDKVKETTAEIAIQTVESLKNKHKQSQRDGAQSVSIEGLSFSYNGTGAIEVSEAIIWKKLADYLCNTGSVGG